MNKIAFRENSGNWIYYLTWLTYKEVCVYVKKIDKELHQSNSLNDMIQRSLTDNVKRIATYIEKQPEHFFNALVLAVYDGDPQWREIELEYDNDEKYARIHKSIKESKLTQKESVIHVVLIDIKKQTDEAVENNHNILKNENFFSNMVQKFVVDGFRKIFKLDAPTAKRINKYVVDEYTNEYNGECA